MVAEFTLLPHWFVTGAIEKAIGRYVTRNEESRESLRALTGKVIALRATPFDLSWYLIPTPDGIQVRTELSGSPDVILSGTPLAFAKLGLEGFERRDLFSGDIEISGDVGVAKLLQQLLRSSKVDWEDLLGSFAGSAVAHRLFGWTAEARDWGRTAAAHLRQDIAEFLQEEDKGVPSVPEADAFLAGVDQLRDDCERLEARIGRLRKALLETPPTPH